MVGSSVVSVVAKVVPSLSVVAIVSLMNQVVVSLIAVVVIAVDSSLGAAAVVPVSALVTVSLMDTVVVSLVAVVVPVSVAEDFAVLGSLVESVLVSRIEE